MNTYLVIVTLFTAICAFIAAYNSLPSTLPDGQPAKPPTNPPVPESTLLKDIKNLLQGMGQEQTLTANSAREAQQSFSEHVGTELAELHKLLDEAAQRLPHEPTICKAAELAASLAKSKGKRA